MDLSQPNSYSKSTERESFAVESQGGHLQSGGSRTWWNVLNIFNRMGDQRRAVQYTALGTDESKLLPEVTVLLSSVDVTELIKRQIFRF